ncbi:MAG: NAD-dependent succinate-semialdehyde dehydrogenase [Kamptonema sp. SIO4C4]|nr:NAD-dependent succinate-semialdehyde dehydrogenase [Kamptonema sp. SIO4C4]
MAIATINPYTGETLKTFTPLTSAEIATKLTQAQSAYLTYRQTPMTQRSQWLQKAAHLLEANSQAYGQLMTTEMGKPLKSAVAEAKKCAWVCRYYAENAAQFLQDQPGESDGSAAFVRYQPLGVILAVMPWNFPFWQVFRFAAPALMAGNVAVLKHASNVPQCAIAIEAILRDAGFPDNVFQTLLIGAEQVETVLQDERVQAATLTGSEPAGASLAATAGKYIKKTVLELGGSDPFIVLNSADLDQAVQTAVTARMLNNGQSCIAAKRFILQTGIADEFEQRLLEKFQGLKVGDPMADDIDIGPLATPAIRDELAQQVEQSLAMGAKALIGGKPLDGPGNFYPPTLLTQIPPDAPAACEELFGPVASLFRVETLDEAIALANHTPLGLGASAWTKIEAERDRLINDLEAGAVFINGMVKSDPRLPFGGIKRSGYGRELSLQGIQEFVNIKTVWLG